MIVESSELVISGSIVISFVKPLQRGEKNTCLSEPPSIFALVRVLEEYAV